MPRKSIKPRAEPAPHRLKSGASAPNGASEPAPHRLKSGASAPSAAGEPAPEKKLEYGVYEAHITAAQREQLSRMPQKESQPEIHLLRAQVDAFLTRMEECEDEDRQIKLFNAALSAMQRLLMALRTQHSLEDNPDEGLSDFNRALAEVQEEMGLRGME